MMNIKMDDKAVVEIAQELLGFENWITEESNSGWHTCLITGKKMRSTKARQQLEKQKDSMAYIEDKIMESEAEEAEQKEVVGKYDGMADKLSQMSEEEFIESDEGAKATEAENAQSEAVVFGEEQMTTRLHSHYTEYTASGKAIKMTTIECEDCGAPRKIKVQDKFQVTRCVDCQKKHRNRRRAQRRKEKRQEEREANK